MLGAQKRLRICCTLPARDASRDVELSFGWKVFRKVGISLFFFAVFFVLYLGHEDCKSGIYTI